MKSAINITDIGRKYEFYTCNNTEVNWGSHDWMLTLIDRVSIVDGAMERIWDMISEFYKQ